MKQLVTQVILTTLLIAGTANSQIIRIDELFVQLPQPASIEPQNIGFAIPSQLNFTGSGARAAAMGGAFMAISDDASAVSWNPAGLYKHDKVLVGFSWGSFAPRGDFSTPNRIEPQTPSFSDLGMLTVVAPLRVKGHPVVASIGITRVDDEFSSTESRDSMLFDSDGTDGTTFSEIELQWNSRTEFESGLQAINLGFGTRVSGNLSAGLALNIYTGRGESNQFASLDAPGIQLFDFFQSRNLTAQLRTRDSIKYSGLNFTLGFQFDQPKYALAMFLRTPFRLQLDTDRLYTTDVKVEGNSFDGDTLLFDNQIIELDMPFIVGAGVAVRPATNLLFALDGEYRAFSGANDVRFRDSLELIPGQESREVFTEDSTFFEKVFTVRLGGEYIWNTGSTIFPVVPIRAGFSYVPLPGPNRVEVADSSSITGIVTELSQAEAISFSLGGGVHFAQIHLDFAYVRTTFDKDVVNRTILDSTERALLEGKNNEFKFSFTGFF